MDPYDLKLQTVGLSIGFDATVVRGSIDARSFSIVYLRQGRVIALDCVNAVRDYVQGRALVAARANPAAADLADVQISLKALIPVTSVRVRDGACHRGSRDPMKR